eukprot:929603-Prorocentrum_minimum.AAC.5
MADLRALLSSAPVTVFSVPGCKACKQAVREIKQEDIACNLVDCSKKGGDAIRAALVEATGTNTCVMFARGPRSRTCPDLSRMPYVFMGDKYVGSLEDGPEPGLGVLPMIDSGKLQQMVAAAPSVTKLELQRFIVEQSSNRNGFRKTASRPIRNWESNNC